MEEVTGSPEENSEWILMQMVVHIDIVHFAQYFMLLEYRKTPAKITLVLLFMLTFETIVLT